MTMMKDDDDDAGWSDDSCFVLVASFWLCRFDCDSPSQALKFIRLATNASHDAVSAAATAADAAAAEATHAAVAAT